MDLRIAPPFTQCFLALGNSARENEIVAHGKGALLFEELQADGTISVRNLCEWWASLSLEDTLQQFMEQHFTIAPGIRNEGSTHRLFKFRTVDADLTLAEAFACLEEGKQQANIESYSLGQTTLEQIFNQFAAAQQQSAEF